MKCNNCHVKMIRVDLEVPGNEGINATFECPQCHSRSQKVIGSKTDF
jgi:Zn finger protein HypA/HybF involved in hydrogenase expression